MAINVLFLYPNTFGMNMLPPAVALFTALLRNNGHNVEIFDSTYYQTDYGIDSDGTKMDFLNVRSFDMGERDIRMRTTDWRQDLRQQVERFQPDLIAMSTTEDMWLLGCRLLDEISDIKHKRQIPVVVGGVFPTFAPHLVIRNPDVDCVCVGEGEHAITDLADRIDRGEDYRDVTNLVVRSDDGTPRRNPIRKPVDVNTNPIIDVTMFEENRLYRPMAGRVYRMMPIETSRGCPYSCTFCNSPDQNRLYRSATGSGYFRKRRIDLVHKELKHFKDNLGVEYFYFWADTFLAMNGKEFDAFCEMYEDIGLPFWFQTRPETLTTDKVRRLKNVGLHRIAFGIEHGNEAFRERMLDRRWKNEDIIEALKIPVEFDVPFSVNNITGFPEETREIAFDTVELNRQINADNHNLYSFTPFHGTPLRKICEDQGLIEPDEITTSVTDKPCFEMEQYTVDEIMGLRKCFVLYVKFPKSRWKDIERAEKNTEEGNRIYNELRAEYFDRYLKKPAATSQDHKAELEYGLIA